MSEGLDWARHLPRVEKDIMFLQRRLRGHVLAVYLSRGVSGDWGNRSLPWLGGESVVEQQPREGGVASRGERDVEERIPKSTLSFELNPEPDHART
jgi:hypothetical protein